MRQIYAGVIETRIAEHLHRKDVTRNHYTNGTPEAATSASAKFAACQDGFKARVTKDKDMMPSPLPNISAAYHPCRLSSLLFDLTSTPFRSTGTISHHKDRRQKWGPKESLPVSAKLNCLTLRVRFTDQTRLQRIPYTNLDEQLQPVWVLSPVDKA